MGLFNKLMGGSAPEKLNWNALTDVSQLETLIEESKTQTIALFKHSTRCGISRMVLKSFENDYDLDDHVKLYFLDLLNYRNISNEISSRFGIHHESPQLIVFKNEKVVHHSSHGGIQVERLSEFV